MSYKEKLDPSNKKVTQGKQSGASQVKVQRSVSATNKRRRAADQVLPNPPSTKPSDNNLTVEDFIENINKDVGGHIYNEFKQILRRFEIASMKELRKRLEGEGRSVKKNQKSLKESNSNPSKNAQDSQEKKKKDELQRINETPEEMMRSAQDLVSSGFWKSCNLEASHGPAEWKCLHCGDYMCSSCTNLHKRGKKNRQHFLLHKSRQLDEDSIREDLFCSRHDGKEKEKYCKTDREKICENCKTESHSPHDVVSLSNMAEDARSQVGECLVPVDKAIPTYTKIIERIDNCITETKNQVVNCRIIDEAVEEVISMVKTRGIQLKKDENARYSQELRVKLVKERDDLELDVERMKKTLFESRKFLETSNDIELINGASNYIEKLSRWRLPDYEKVDKEPSSVRRITVQHIIAQLEGLQIKEEA